MRRKHSETRRRALLALAALPAAKLALAAEDIDSKRTGGPFVPTPQVVVDEMLRIGKVGAGDFVVDLGSGNGVIVLTAATRLKARGFGVDIDPQLVALSNAEAKKLGVADQAAFYVQDVFKTDLGKATVVTLYLLPGMMIQLQPKIFTELKPGTRVVSHDYRFSDDWAPEEYYSWDVPEKEKINGVPRATVYLWIVPASVGGRWQVEVAAPASEKLELTLRQNYSSIDGAATVAGKAVKLTQSNLSGSEITFAFPADGGRHLFRGRISGDAMEGTVQLANGKGAAKWSAARSKG